MAQTRAKIISTSVISCYHHKTGTFLFGSHVDFTSSLIESLEQPKIKELDMVKKMKASDLLRRHLQLAVIALTRSCTV